MSMNEAIISFRFHYLYIFYGKMLKVFLFLAFSHSSNRKCRDALIGFGNRSDLLNQSFFSNRSRRSSFLLPPRPF